MGLSEKEAEVRIFGNDLVNAKFIKENMNMDFNPVIGNISSKINAISNL